MTISTDRFAVSAEGMRELHADREPWHLVKELVQNAWDEYPEATTCHVYLEPVPNQAAVWVTVEDDGPGFRDIADAYTLMGHTPKRLDPTVRGRFNTGEKELISVAREAEIDTVGRRVIFPREGGRTVRLNRRERGTVVRALLPWTRSQTAELAVMLRRFRPSECALVVNGEPVPERQVLVRREAALATVLQTAHGEPMRPTRRHTALDILTPLDDTAWLYEMGIPVQPIDCAYDIDVQQKVPLPPNRDTVGAAYLQDVYSEALNAVYELMHEDDFAKSWVRAALQDHRIEEPAVRATVSGQYGNRVVTWSSDRDANIRAAEEGYVVIPRRAMTPEERKTVREHAGLQSASELFPEPGSKPAETIDYEGDPVLKRFADWVVELATMADMTASVQFYEDRTLATAWCTTDSRTPQVSFNLSKLSRQWLAERGHQQIELIIHELGHAQARRNRQHGPVWGEGCCVVAGKIVAGLSDESAVKTDGTS